ncbi:MAG TPA: ester cyclase [Solirubrobacterales bacterium]|jgi:predicted ester cyclase
MTAKEHPGVVVMEAFDSRDFDLARKHLSDDSVVRETPTGEAFRGADGVITEFRRWIGACSNAQNNIHRIFGEGDLAVMEGVWSGTHDGDLVFPDVTLPPTGGRIEFPFATVARAEGEIYIEGVHYYDLASVSAQLGLA